MSSEIRSPEKEFSDELTGPEPSGGINPFRWWRRHYIWSTEMRNLSSELVSLTDRLSLLHDEAEDRAIDIDRYLTMADRETNRAAEAHKRVDIVSFWRHFSEAKKWELVAIERLYRDSTDDEYASNLLDSRAQDVLLQAADVLDDQQLRKVERGLSQSEPRERYYRDIVSSIHLIHRQHINHYLERRRNWVLESQLQFFMSVIALCLVLLFYVWLEFFGEAGVVTDELFSIEFIFTVVLFGAMGAAVSSLSTLSKVLERSRVPERVGSVRLAVARVVLGAASALILYTFVFAEIVNVFVISASSLLAIAFVSGFSERLLVRTVQRVTGERNERSERFAPDDWFEDEGSTRGATHDGPMPVELPADRRDVDEPGTERAGDR